MILVIIAIIFGIIALFFLSSFLKYLLGIVGSFLSNLLSIIIGFAIIAVIIALCIFIPPLGLLIIICLIVWAIISSKKNKGKIKDGDYE